MYDYIKGRLVKITAKYIVIEANGLGYIVTVANPYSFSDQMNSDYPSLIFIRLLEMMPTFFWFSY